MPVCAHANPWCCAYVTFAIRRAGVANRIGKGSFTLDGKKYQLPLNDKDYDTLHGGWVGYDRRVWTVLEQTASSVKFGLESPDGEMGFPGKLLINVTHTLTRVVRPMFSYGLNILTQYPLHPFQASY